MIPRRLRQYTRPEPQRFVLTVPSHTSYADLEWIAKSFKDWNTSRKSTVFAVTEGVKIERLR